jgi:uncharacterized protein (DUF3084 family)
MKIIEKEFNVQTGEETITEREETTQETKMRLDYEKAAKAEAEAQAQASKDKAAILNRLGLTEDELKTILG